MVARTKTNAAGHVEARGFHQFWWKLLVTYLAVVAISLAAVIVVIRQVSHSTYTSNVRHMQGMGGMMGSMMADLNQAFISAINSSIVWGGLVAAMAAVVLSLVISRRITRPIHDMAAATQSIAEGDYSQRVEVRSSDEIGSLAQSLNGMAVSLEESRRLRRELMANIAHELRTPLTSISGYMEGLEDGVVPATRETYELVRHEAERLSRLVEDLQRLSRAESGQEALDIVNVDLSLFLDRVVRKMSPQFGDKNVSLKLSMIDGIPPLPADEDKLDQVLVNLLDNALRYTDSGGSVTIRSGLQDGMVAIEVADNGAGIAQEDLPHIFERFYRADKSRARVSGGTGIGLTIVKRYIQSLGGQIEVESRVGQGTTFTVLLPAGQSSPSEAL